MTFEKEQSKYYIHGEVERKWYAEWMNRGYFRSIPNERAHYSIVIPPPNVTGILHMGHVLNNTIQDVLARRKRMEGYNVCWVPGTDHASIATEAKVVKMLKEQGIRKADLSREQFLEHAWAWKEKYGGIILNQLKKLGCSCDWERTRFTMEDSLSRAVTEVFVSLYEDGMIYRAERLVHWDVIGKTALSDEEVIRKETQGKLYFVRYEVVGESDKYLTIATTRPETILADTAVAVHPEDDRYREFIGKQVYVPLIKRVIPVIADSYVEQEFGTGCLKITPAHDFNDYEVGKRHQLPLINILNEDGTLNEKAELFVGMDRLEVRDKIVQALKEAGQLEKIEPHVHYVGHSERTDAVVEPLLSMQWFVWMEPLTQPALQAVLEGKIRFHPERFVNTYKHWLENIKDWCISRQLWWGHRIPVYYYKEDPEMFIVARNEEHLKAQIEAQGLTREDFYQDEDVLDTWFSSWLWPLSVFDFFENPKNPDIQYYYPTNDLVTAPEIIFFWVARMIMAGLKFHGDIPFRNVYFTGTVRDKLGRKMSKSLGNSPDPMDLIEKYSADGVRMGMLECAPAGNDLLFDESYCEHGRNFTNKLWNAFKLIQLLESKCVEREVSAVEKLAMEWMEAQLTHTAYQVHQQFSQFRLSEALRTIYNTIWDAFCSIYLELIKPAREENISQSAYDFTVYLFEECLKLLHPFMPFITEELYHQLKEGERDTIMYANVMMPSHQSAIEKEAFLQHFAWAMQFVSEIRHLRSSYHIPSSQSLAIYCLDEQKSFFDNYAPVLQKLANISSIQSLSSSCSQNLFKILVHTYEAFIPLMISRERLEEEIKKVEKELEAAQRLFASTTQKLQNEKFLQNAKADLVEKEKQKQSDARERIASLEQTLSQLKAQL